MNTTRILDLVTFAPIDTTGGLAVVLGTPADAASIVPTGRPVIRTTADALRTELIRAAGTDRRFFARVASGAFHAVERCD